MAEQSNASEPDLDAFEDALLRSTFEAATLYIQTSILANGGAAAAWLAYMGVVQSSDSKAPVIWFGAGLLLAWIASLANYFGQRLNWHCVRNRVAKGTRLFNWCDRMIATAMTLAMLSPVTFIVGGIAACVEL